MGSENNKTKPIGECASCAAMIHEGEPHYLYDVMNEDGDLLCGDCFEEHRRERATCWDEAADDDF